jgi:starch-binding outer membrane protein, SusD/RagB family
MVRARTVSVLVCMAMAACKPSDILTVPPPTGVQPLSDYQSQTGAELLEAGGVTQMSAGFAQGGFNGLLEWSGQLSDEFSWTDFTYEGAYANVDARMTAAVAGFQEPGDAPLAGLLAARVTLLTAVPLLKKYEPPTGRAKVGLAYALIGYTELLVAEDYCAGLPLSTLTTTGAVYGTPLTTDSLLGAAQTDFDSALTNANGDATVLPLASVGYARTLLNRGNFAAADTVLHNVPTSFVYNAELQPGGYNNGGLTISDVYDYYTQYYPCSNINGTSGKGQNGLNYTTANDPRLVFDTAVGETCDGHYGGQADSVWYYPIKFGLTSSGVPLATGVEARLIEAEVALHSGAVGTWVADVNALRANAPNTYLNLASSVPPMTPSSSVDSLSPTQTQAVDIMFRERAFWLYGTGMRLGDMRRLVRQYGRDQSTVFPIGPFPNGNAPTLPAPIPTYGTDVNLTLPTAGSKLTDPNSAYKGCISKAA